MNDFAHNVTKRHLCIAVDAKDYSKLDAVGQEELQAAMMHILGLAAVRAGLERLNWSRQEQGDGELALVPADQDEKLAVDDFPRELDALLDRHNHDRLPHKRLRLRLAIHYGIGYRAENGYAGPAPVLVSRILGSRELHEALSQADGSDLAVALSDGVYNDLILNRLTSLRPEDFHVREIKDDKFEGRAWIRVLRNSVEPPPSKEGDESDRPQRETREDEEGTHGDTYRVKNIFGDNTQVEVAGFKFTRRGR